MKKQQSDIGQQIENMEIMHPYFFLEEWVITRSQQSWK
jgi:hypothetical protein